jgi:hypothetical protein
MDTTWRRDRRVLEHTPVRVPHRICDRTPPFSTPVPASADAAEVARAFAEAHLCEEHTKQASGAVLLVVSELVTHALFYGAPPIVVTVECEVTQVRVTVTDGSPLVQTPDSVHRALSLILIDRLAGDWATELAEHGETFWCTIPTGVA